MSERNEMSEQPTAGTVKVMVVDDHPMWRDAVARDLAAAGFDVVATAGDGPQAVRRARAAAPDVWCSTSICRVCRACKSARNWSEPTPRSGSGALGER